MKSQLQSASIDEISSQLESGEMDLHELLDSQGERISRLDKTLNVFITVFKKASRRPRAGPIHGITLAVKGNK